MVEFDFYVTNIVILLASIACRQVSLNVVLR